MRVNIFVSYSRKDYSYLIKLLRHLSVFEENGCINLWTDTRIAPGQNWEAAINEKLKEADIILLLVTPSYLQSLYSMHEASYASALNKKVVPVLIKRCNWNVAPFSRFQAIPNSGKPIEAWVNQNEAWEVIFSALDVLIDNASKLKNPQTSELQLQLSKIRIALLTTRNERELKKILFELTKIKKTFPDTFEIDELIDKVKESIVYESKIVVSKNIVRTPATGRDFKPSINWVRITIYYILLATFVVLLKNC